VPLFEDGDIVGLLYGYPNIEAAVGGAVNRFEQRECEIAGIAILLDQGKETWSRRRKGVFLAVGVT
jgi:hypothetical protein